MFSVKLNAPVLFRKQLPMIAEALHVDEKVLDDFLSVSAFYGVKDGKGTIVPIKRKRIPLSISITKHMITTTLSLMLSCNTPKTSMPLLLYLSSLKLNSVQMFSRRWLLTSFQILYIWQNCSRQQRPHSKAKRVECAVHSCCQRVRTPVQKGGVP